MKACPYYASRKAVSDAQVVVIPYNTLLHSSTREACNIQLENSVVIIDEAHNVLETIAHIHSAEITKAHVEHARDQLMAYFKKYGGLLKAKNLLYVKQILMLQSKLQKCFQNTKEARLIQLADFFRENDLFNLNLFKLIRYIEKSKISHKLHGFHKAKLEKDAKNENIPEKKKGVSEFLKTLSNNKPTKESDSKTEEIKPVVKVSDTNSPMLPILAFVQSLVNGKSELRILLDPKKSSLKAILLNPASQFTDLVSKCRSIIVAGGTMQPISEFQDQLFIQAGKTFTVWKLWNFTLTTF